MATDDDGALEIVIDKYRLTKRIGNGAFGEIYKGQDMERKDHAVAVKLERVGVQYPQLDWEYRIYSEMKDDAHFPTIHFHGQVDDYRVMVMDLFGHDLESLFNQCQRKFSVPTVQRLGRQMVDRVQRLHQHGVVHRDIKPDNFLWDEKHQRVVLVDMGLAKYWRTKDGKHMKYRDGRSFIGTARYASISNHFGIEQSRRDDLEAVMHVLIYLHRGRLPWQGLLRKQKRKAKFDLVRSKKQATKVRDLCQGLPKGFRDALRYCRALEFDEEPDYEKLKDWLCPVGLHDQRDWDWGSYKALS
jgi:serine/threonine protein kinase